MAEVKEIDPQAVKTIYFMGIAGTGMAAVAGLCKKAGYTVVGSDMNIYPPMSTMLEELKIPVFSPYKPENLDTAKPDLVVVANALSRGNVELEHMMTKDLPFTSFPKLMGDIFLKNRTSLTVTGTHGKTTTSSLATHVLHELGERPSYMIGGIPKNFERSFDFSADSKFFVVEGDEYDTAFFDKGPKFLHYFPKYLIVNNVEYDHADIYASIDAIKQQFVKIITKVPDPSNILLNIDDPGAASLLTFPELSAVAGKIQKVATLSNNSSAFVSVVRHGPDSQGSWTAEYQVRGFGSLKVKTSLAGNHNIANIAQVVATVVRMHENNQLKQILTMDSLARAIASFKGVKRRLEHLGAGGGIDVFEDFAHHPTAVRTVIEGFRKLFPSRRLHVAFEPRNATSRRNVFQGDYIETFKLADAVYLGQCPTDARIPEDQKMNTSEIAKALGAKGHSYKSNDDLLAELQNQLRTGDAVIFMSSGSFSGIQHKLAAQISQNKS